MSELPSALPGPDSGRPSRTRYKVVALAVVLAMLTYVDRASIATLAPRIMSELALSKVQMGYVFSIFAFAYAVFAIPTAGITDRLGARSVLTVIVAWWSAFTLLTGAAIGSASLLATRLLFGVGEAGAWPAVTHAFARWIPERERGKVQGIFFAAAHLAAALTPVIVTGMLVFMPWRFVFACLGVAGGAWAACWHFWFRDEPAEHRGVNPAEREIIAAGRTAPSAESRRPLRRGALARSRSLWALCAMYFPNSFVLYFCITWLPTYLQERHGFHRASLLYFSGLPLALSVLADLAGGWTVDWVSARFGLRAGRCGLGAVAYVAAAVALCAVPRCHNAALAATLLAAAVGAGMFALPAAWAVCVDIGGSHAGMVSAIMNTAGQVGSLLSPLIVAYSLKWRGDWDTPIYLMGGLLLAGAGFWAFVDPRSRIEED